MLPCQAYSFSPGGSPFVDIGVEDTFVTSKFVVEGQFACRTPGKAEVPLCAEISGSFPKSLFTYFIGTANPHHRGVPPPRERLTSQFYSSQFIRGCEHFALKYN